MCVCMCNQIAVTQHMYLQTNKQAHIDTSLYMDIYKYNTVVFRVFPFPPTVHGRGCHALPPSPLWVGYAVPLVVGFWVSPKLSSLRYCAEGYEL